MFQTCPIFFVSSLSSMASKKFFHAKTNYIYPNTSSDTTTINNNDMVFEFDESDVWNSKQEPQRSNMSKKTIPSSRSYKKLQDMQVERKQQIAGKSLPVNIPDWSNILKDHYRGHERCSDEDVEDYEDFVDGDMRIPPHEYLARNRGASFSVHEGVGRTLKGRDLSRVRNAIWKITGFQD